MDRDALAARNRQLAEAFHAAPMQHRLRQRLLVAVSRVPFTPMPTLRVPRILFIKPDHIGDLLLATPAIRATRHALPQAEIHVLAGPWAAPLLNPFAEIDQVLTVRFPGFDRSELTSQPLAPYTQLISVSRQLRAVGYSAAVILRPDHWWGAMLAHVAGIPRRIGYAHPDVAPFLTHSTVLQTEHVVRQNMRLVEGFTGTIPDERIPYNLPVASHDAHFIMDWKAAKGISLDAPMICIHAGAGTHFKQWDALRWAQVADALSEQLDAQIILTGSASENTLVTTIRQAMQHRAISAAGELSLGQLAALYERANLVIGCDSGPLHIAAAVHTPTVTLFGPANPLEFAPWGDRTRHIVLASNIACRPCRVLDWGDDDPANHPCLRDIGIGEVLNAARRMRVAP